MRNLSVSSTDLDPFFLLSFLFLDTSAYIIWTRTRTIQSSGACFRSAARVGIRVDVVGPRISL